MCFDTTASNTGRLAEACVLLKQKLGRPLFYFTCRHHVLEIILTGVFNALYDSFSGHDIQLFKRFQKRWKSINKENSIPVNQDSEASKVLSNYKDAFNFAKECLNKGTQRDDYMEFLGLAILFLGEKCQTTN